MGKETSTTDTFEQILEEGRRALSTARDEYSALEETETVPDALVEAIGDLERELNELDQTLDVTDEDIQLAEQTSRRVSVLADVLSALRTRQRLLVEARLERLELRLSGLADLISENDHASRLEKLQRQLSMLNKLADSDRYEQVVTNERVSPERIDTAIRQLESDLDNDISSDELLSSYVTVCKDILDEIHEVLTNLSEDNDAKTAFSTDLRQIKDLLNGADTSDGQKAVEETVTDARTALEGALMLHELTQRAQAEEQVSKELAAVVEETNLSVDCDVEQCIVQGDASTLLLAIADVITSEVQLSAGQRVQQLLREHDGSVIRTAEATDFDVPTIMAHLEQLYQQGHISNIEVEFDQ